MTDVLDEQRLEGRLDDLEPMHGCPVIEDRREDDRRVGAGQEFQGEPAVVRPERHDTRQLGEPCRRQLPVDGESPERAKREALAWLTRFRIPDYADRRAEELSKGNQQKVQFIAAVLHDPEVLLMDEPFTGLDPVNLVLLREAFTELRDRGRTLIFSTHQMEAAEALCESVAIVDHGRLVAGGRVRDLKRASVASSSDG